MRLRSVSPRKQRGVNRGGGEGDIKTSMVVCEAVEMGAGPGACPTWRTLLESGEAMQALTFWKAVAMDRANFLEGKRRKDLLDIERLVECYPELRERVPAKILERFR